MGERVGPMNTPPVTLLPWRIHTRLAHRFAQLERHSADRHSGGRTRTLEECPFPYAHSVDLVCRVVCFSDTAWGACGEGVVYRCCCAPARPSTSFFTCAAKIPGRQGISLL